MKPTTAQLAHIPAALKRLNRWACHRSKEPVQPHGAYARCNDPATWHTLDECVAALNDFDGVGFMLGDGTAAADLDHCVSDDGSIHPEARRIIAFFDSYTEYSLSHKGIHIWMLGQLPAGRRIRNPPPIKIELYDSVRFLVVTGDHLDGTPAALAERTSQLAQFHAELFPTARPSAHPPAQPVLAGDSDLLHIMFNASNGPAIQALWNGDTSALSGDESSADLALCNHLAFYTGGDPERIDRLFRRSRLFREKWDAKRGAQTYGERTIEKALEGMTEFYKPPRLNGNGSGHDHDPKPVQLPAIIETPEPFMPELPRAAFLDEAIGEDACPWLNDYIALSRRWAPRAFGAFHETVGLFVLSTVAARRVMCHLGKTRYTNLYLSLVSRSSLYTKSSAAEIGVSLLRHAGADFLLAPDESTPQRFIVELTPYIPEDFDQWPPERQERHHLRLALPGQRGWFMEEFGQHLDAMMRRDGFMADFRGMLRKFDDCPERYEVATIKRGTNVIEHPYLALLGNMTPADLGRVAKRGSSLWSDGYLARFAFVTPRDSNMRMGRFPIGQREQDEAFAPLVREVAAFHHRLGVPPAMIEEERSPEGHVVRRYAIAPQIKALECRMSTDLIDAFYAYHDALVQIAARSTNYDLDANYNRLAEKALRVAMLLAAFSSDGNMTLMHWAKAQAIAERWREGLHALFEQVNQGPASEESQLEEKVLWIIQHLQSPTAREIQQRLWKVTAADLDRLLQALERNGTIERRKEGRTYRFSLLGNVESVESVGV